MLRKFFREAKKFLPKLFVGITGPKMHKYSFLDEDKEKENEKKENRGKEIYKRKM